MSNIPKELKYTTDHEWVKIEGDVITIGITDYAQHELGDIVYVELPELDDEVSKDESLGEIEAVKTVADILSPATGTILEINETLSDNAEIINSDPYTDGWIVKIKISDKNELSSLLDSDAYTDIL